MTTSTAPERGNEEGAQQNAGGGVGTWWGLTTAQATVLATVIPLLVTGVTAAVTRVVSREPDDRITHEARAIREARDRLRGGVQQPPGQTRHVVERVGIAFHAPAEWQFDAEAQRFGSGEMDLIKSFDASKSISQGVKLRVVPVQVNYSSDPAAEKQNKLDALRAVDPEATAEDSAVSGMPAVRFTYKQKSGLRMANIRQYWVRLSGRAKLDILQFTNVEEQREGFFGEAQRVVDSLLIDKVLIGVREANLNSSGSE